MKKFVRGIRKFIQLLRSFGRALHNPRTCILFVIVIALSCVSVFLYVTRPTQLDKLGISYLELLEVLFKKMFQRNSRMHMKPMII